MNYTIRENGFCEFIVFRFKVYKVRLSAEGLFLFMHKNRQQVVDESLDANIEE